MVVEGALEEEEELVAVPMDEAEEEEFGMLEEEEEDAMAPKNARSRSDSATVYTWHERG